MHAPWSIHIMRDPQPRPTLCSLACWQRYGASAMVLDQRIFVSFNPFNIFVTQADVKPGCVLRAANIGQVLEARGLLTPDEVRGPRRHLR